MNAFVDPIDGEDTILNGCYDGFDNDCDGSIDEGDPEGGFACRTPDRRGVCGVGQTTCVDGAITCPSSTAPSEERCDGLDNDCDGVTDEETATVLGLCDTGRFGVCSEGNWTCTVEGLSCVEVTSPYAERCDGLDNDCDGQVDEGELISPEACSTGFTGLCAEGVTACLEGGQVCIELSEPQAESCDGVDNDCDGSIDEQLRNDCGRCGETPLERCDGVDEDCDGLVDEGELCSADEICALGRCVTECDNGECRDSGTTCIDNGCVPTCEATVCNDGLSCREGRCVDLCTDVECTSGAVCREGRCVGNTCYEAGCGSGEICLQNECVEDPCRELDCEAGQFCRISATSDGDNNAECARSCAVVSCRRGERCENGECFSDPCYDVSCLEGQVCSEGVCARDPCAGVLCGPGRVCLAGQCQDNPCAHVTCPRGQRCDLNTGRAECYYDEQSGGEDEVAGGDEVVGGDEAVAGDEVVGGEEVEVSDMGTAGISMRQLEDFGELPVYYYDQGLKSGSPQDEGCQAMTSSASGPLHRTHFSLLIALSLIVSMRRRGILDQS